MSKYDDILDATLNIIEVEGLHSVTFAKILKEASVGVSTIYNYFNNKDELVDKLYIRSRNNMSKQLLIGYVPDMGLYEKFKCIVRNYLNYALEYPKEFSFIDRYSFSSSIPASIRNMVDENEQSHPSGTSELLSVISEGQRNGILQDMNRYMSIQMIHGIISSIMKGHYIQKYPLNELQVQQTIDACWKAIKV